MDLEERMKSYEFPVTSSYLMKGLPAICRVDGRNFHRLTKDLERPFDSTFHDCMVETTRDLMVETGALVGYTQSDEITIAWNNPNLNSQIFFGGKIFKLLSVIASLASTRFVYHLSNSTLWRKVQDVQVSPFDYGGELSIKKDLPVFDCRVFNVPSLAEAANVFVWRELDATRNSISMLARCHFSHKDLQNKSSKQVQEMLFQQKGINWDNMPEEFKRGTYLRSLFVIKPFTPDEIDGLPEKHLARKDPDLLVEKRVIETLNLPPITKIRNRIDVLFFGKAPEIGKLLPQQISHE